MLYKRLRLTLATLLLITCGACSSGPGGPGNVTLASSVPDLLQADSIQIKTDWTGLSSVAPIEAHYALQRVDKEFKGEAQFSVAGYSKQPRRATEDVVIPLDAAQSFLKTLTQLPLREGKYEPKIEHTDDYPSISIELKTKTETILIFTKSQGKDNIPWGATFKGKTFVVESDIPARALKELEPYLKHSVLQKLIEQK